MAAVEKITSPTLKKILAGGRHSFNTLFATGRHFYPHIEPEIFSHYLKHIVEPVVISLEKEKNIHLAALVFHLYERLLELIGKRLLANRGRRPYFDEAFTKMICGLPHMILQQPERFTGAVGNAIVNISAAAAGGIHLWVETMLTIGEHTTALDEFLEAGQVAAWRCGLAHYRDSALQICERLRLDLVKIALNVPEDMPLSREVLVSGLKKNPWLEPRLAGKPPGKTRLILRRSGAFSGFGGAFITPPQVKTGSRGFLVRDADRRFIFFADIFGSALLPLREEECDEQVSGGKEEQEREFKLTTGGALAYGQSSYSLPRLTGFSSFASSSHTFCATIPLSHSLFFGGLAKEE
jgi:hypothetical protein